MDIGIVNSTENRETGDTLMLLGMLGVCITSDPIGITDRFKTIDG